MKVFKDLELSVEQIERLEKAVQSVFDDLIYKRVEFALKRFKSVQLRRDEVTNSVSDIVKAIVDGKLQYIDGRFEGEINSKIGKELRAIGADYDPRLKAYHLPKDKLPMDISLAVGTMASAFQQLHKNIVDSLDTAGILEELEKRDFTKDYQQTIDEYEAQFRRATKSISVKADISQGMEKAIAENYSDNMKLYIKDWTEENIKKLREDVKKNAFSGGRAKSLENLLNNNYGVSTRKAKFLAKQESQLLMAQYRKQRYQQAGVRKYKWRTAGDSRVREEHKRLNGKIFLWDEAVIDDKGHQGNPGEAFGCRCKAEPILE